MFTGIVQAVGQVVEREERGGDLRLAIDAGALAARVEPARLAVGESIAVSGVCLTVVEWRDGRFIADVSRETLALTTLGRLAVGEAVNLEAALRVGDPLGGHLMSGHVDGIARITSMARDARSMRLTIEPPPALAGFIAPKGSVALDGVSLTVNEVDDRGFGVNLIPHTVELTTFRQAAPGRLLNLEVDLLARYVQRALGI
jgi:riboflavin synthase|nr:MAG: riboflavin synthase [Pseudomonadota bacterium]